MIAAAAALAALRAASCWFDWLLKNDLRGRFSNRKPGACPDWLATHQSRD
jgi:hypothetical protein